MGSGPVVQRVAEKSFRCSGMDWPVRKGAQAEKAASTPGVQSLGWTPGLCSRQRGLQPPCSCLAHCCPTVGLAFFQRMVLAGGWPPAPGGAASFAQTGNKAVGCESCGHCQGLLLRRLPSWVGWREQISWNTDSAGARPREPLSLDLETV